MVYTVKQLADLAKISIRTLHYYDEIGLLNPSFTKENGYRYYEEKELIKLQQILFFRELEFPLEDIVRIINDPKFDVITALQEHKKLIQLKKDRLKGLLHTIDNTIKHMKGGEPMKNNDLYDSFNMDEIEQYKKEAKERWGNTEAYKQSQERTKHWTKEDYKRVQEEGNRFTQQIADAMDKGPEHVDVQKLIQVHYDSINQFYDCSLEMYINLGQMYVDDKRFTAFYEKFRPGMAVFMRDAIVHYAKVYKKK